MLNLFPFQRKSAPWLSQKYFLKTLGNSSALQKMRLGLQSPQQDSLFPQVFILQDLPESIQPWTKRKVLCFYLNWWLTMFFRRKRELSKVSDQKIFSKTGLLSLEQWQLQKEQKSRQFPNKPYANYSRSSQSHWIWDPDSKGEFLHHQWKFLWATTTMVRPERPNIHSFNICSWFCR